MICKVNTDIWFAAIQSRMYGLRKAPMVGGSNTGCHKNNPLRAKVYTSSTIYTDGRLFLNRVRINAFCVLGGSFPLAPKVVGKLHYFLA